MDPSTQPTPPPTTPPNYLDSIAPPESSSKMNPKLMWLLIGGGLLLLVGIVVALLAGGSNQTDQIRTLAYELQSLESLTSDQQPNLQSSDLRQINSSLNLLLTNANHDITEPLASNGIKQPGDEPPKGSTAPAEFDKLKSKLDDARLNAIFDRTYARELSYQLDKMLIEINDLYSETSSPSLKSFLKTTYDNLSPIQKQFADFKGDGS